MHSGRPSALESLVHAPIVLFAIPVPFALGAAVSLSGSFRAAALVAAWWLASGAAVMAADARAREARYERLAALADGRRGAGLPRQLTQTLCGRFMFWALRYRLRAGRRIPFRKEWGNE